MVGTSKYESEVVVIGASLAGMVTALQLLDAGKRVVMLDAASRDRFGGLDPEDVWPYRWAEAYVNRCTEEVRTWFAERDVSFFRAISSGRGAT